MNFGNEDFVKTSDNQKREFTKEFTKDGGEFTKEFAKAKREIYRCISSDSHITRTQMAEHIGLSVRQVQKYLKRLTDLGLIIREDRKSVV